MIQANELRLGNRVVQGEIKSFYEYGAHFGHGVCERFSDLLPIPLTEEILLKCGFEKNEDFGIVFSNQSKYIVRKVNFGVPIEGKEDFGWSCELSDDKNWCDIKRIKHLHQLQNLYLALTGKELEINL